MPAQTALKFDIHTASGLLDPLGIVSLKEAAELCGVHRDTIDNHRKYGHLPQSRQLPQDPHKRWYVRIADLVTAHLLNPDFVEGGRDLVPKSEFELQVEAAIAADDRFTALEIQLTAIELANHELAQKVLRLDKALKEKVFA